MTGIEASLGLKLDGIKTSVDEVAKIQQGAQIAQQTLLRGIKQVRLPLVIGTAVASALTMGGDSGQFVATPESGYVWSVRHLAIEGLTTGTTPDVVNIIRAGRIIWQLNGNQFAQTWGRGEIMVYAGETLTYQSVGTFASTNKIIAHGTVDNLPGEMAGRLI